MVAQSREWEETEEGGVMAAKWVDVGARMTQQKDQVPAQSDRSDQILDDIQHHLAEQSVGHHFDSIYRTGYGGRPSLGEGKRCT